MDHLRQIFVNVLFNQSPTPIQCMKWQPSGSSAETVMFRLLVKYAHENTQLTQVTVRTDWFVSQPHRYMEAWQRPWIPVISHRIAKKLCDGGFWTNNWNVIWCTAKRSHHEWAYESFLIATDTDTSKYHTEEWEWYNERRVTSAVKTKKLFLVLNDHICNAAWMRLTLHAHR